MLILWCTLLCATWWTTLPPVHGHIKKIAKDEGESEAKWLIDLSYPYNNKTMHWVTARDFALKYILRGVNKVNEEELW